MKGFQNLAIYKNDRMFMRHHEAESLPNKVPTHWDDRENFPVCMMLEAKQLHTGYLLPSPVVFHIKI